MKIIDVGNQFYARLANRDKFQGDGKNTAINFRNEYLKELDSEDAWQGDELFIILDFKNVRKLGPSFANEAFAYFTKYNNATPDRILKRIKFQNISRVKKSIIDDELENGYKG